ncbi:flagellar assembly peptidoglycan hydrolase FlgJ [Aquitalea sp. S1-19]|nr:flagellar assembly peptidoglycan hydrolase FlgJ [Aquitalea sp. S1-19]
MKAGFGLLCSVFLLSACASHQPPAPSVQATKFQEVFVARMLPHAQPAAQELGVAPELIVAHAALESGWGQRPIRQPDGSDSHNLFSLKATRSWQGDTTKIWTTEYLKGRKLKRQEVFRAYPSFGAAFDDYAALLLRLDRYADVRNQGDDAEAFARALHAGGYATDPAYVDKLVGVARGLQQLEAGSDAGI